MPVHPRNPGELAGVKLRADLEKFKKAAVIIEGKMRASGLECFCVNGSRLRNKGHRDRLITVSKSNEAAINALEAAIFNINKGIKKSDYHGLIAALIVLQESASGMRTIIEKEKSKYAVDFVKNPTAG